MMKSCLTRVMLLCSAALLFTLAGCGSGGGGGAQSSGVTAVTTFQDNQGNMFLLSEDTLGLEEITYMCSSVDSSQVVLRTAIAQSDYDPAFRTVFRIDITHPERIGAGGGDYPVDAADPTVGIIFFNGQASTSLTTRSGSITFTSFGSNIGSVISGSFDVVVEDQNPEIPDPKPQYVVSGEFRFVIR